MTISSFKQNLREIKKLLEVKKLEFKQEVDFVGAEKYYEKAACTRLLW